MGKGKGVSAAKGKDDEVVAVEEVDGHGSEGGERRKAASGEGDQWQGVSGY